MIRSNSSQGIELSLSTSRVGFNPDSEIVITFLAKQRPNATAKKLWNDVCQRKVSEWNGLAREAAMTQRANEKARQAIKVQPKIANVSVEENLVVIPGFLADRSWRFERSYCHSYFIGVRFRRRGSYQSERLMHVFDCP
jgi:hypothetical protein